MPRTSSRQSSFQRRHRINLESQEWRVRYGPWAVVTGGSRGIGYAFASRLAALGLHLVLVGRNRSTLEDAANTLRARYPIKTSLLSTDLAEPDACGLVRERTANLDVGLVVLNAGDGLEGRFSQHTLEDEQRIARLNVIATLDLSHAFASRLQKRGRGGLIIVSSLLAYQGAPFAANYAATKAYGLVLGESLHFELRPYGVDALAVAPGPTETGATQRVDQHHFLDPQWCSAGHVVDTALGALGRRASVVPGAANNFLLWSGGFFAREARSSLIGRIARNLAAESHS